MSLENINIIYNSLKDKYFVILDDRITLDDGITYIKELVIILLSSPPTPLLLFITFSAVGLSLTVVNFLIFYPHLVG